MVIVVGVVDVIIIIFITIIVYLEYGLFLSNVPVFKDNQAKVASPTTTGINLMQQFDCIHRSITIRSIAIDNLRLS